jgi:hypothetical protein
MLELLSAAGRSFLRAFLASILVLAPGILAAPNLNKMYLLGVAAILASIAAGIRAIQAYVPEISLVHYLGHPYGDWADSFLRAFLASLVVTLPGVLNAPDLSTGRSLATAAIIGAFTAGIRALQGFFTAGEHPSPGLGLSAPEMPYSYAHPPRSQQP